MRRSLQQNVVAGAALSLKIIVTDSRYWAKEMAT